MADLSLEDIATQLEEALGTETGTTITPGTISPVGTQLSGGRKKLSWPEVVQRIKDNIADTKVDALESINSLKLREFTKKKQSQKTKIGLVAQEVLNSKIPELVGTTSNESYKEYFDESEDKKMIEDLSIKIGEKLKSESKGSYKR